MAFTLETLVWTRVGALLDEITDPVELAQVVSDTTGIVNVPVAENVKLMCRCAELVDCP